MVAPFSALFCFPDPSRHKRSLLTMRGCFLQDVVLKLPVTSSPSPSDSTNTTCQGHVWGTAGPPPIIFAKPWEQIRSYTNCNFFEQRWKEQSAHVCCCLWVVCFKFRDRSNEDHWKEEGMRAEEFDQFRFLNDWYELVSKCLWLSSAHTVKTGDQKHQSGTLWTSIVIWVIWNNALATHLHCWKRTSNDVFENEKEKSRAVCWEKSLNKIVTRPAMMI